MIRSQAATFTARASVRLMALKSAQLMSADTDQQPQSDRPGQGGRAARN